MEKNGWKDNIYKRTQINRLPKTKRESVTIARVEGSGGIHVVRMAVNATQGSCGGGPAELKDETGWQDSQCGPDKPVPSEGTQQRC